MGDHVPVRLEVEPHSRGSMLRAGFGCRAKVLTQFPAQLRERQIEDPLEDLLMRPSQEAVDLLLGGDGIPPLMQVPARVGVPHRRQEGELRKRGGEGLECAFQVFL